MALFLRRPGRAGAWPVTGVMLLVKTSVRWRRLLVVLGGHGELSAWRYMVAVLRVVILVLSLAFNLLGDGLRDALDARLRTVKSQV